MRADFCSIRFAGGFLRTCAMTSQSVIAGINLLTVFIPGRGQTFAAGVAAPCSKNGLSKRFLPALPNNKEVHADVHGVWTTLA